MPIDRRSSNLPLVFVLVALALTTPLVAQTTPLRIGTFNIENFDDRSGMPQFEAALAVILRVNPDVICLQEIVSQYSIEDLARDAGYPYYWHADRGYAIDSQRRSAIMSRYPLSEAYTLHAPDISGDPEARDIARNFSVMHLNLPGPGPEVIAISNHWMSQSGDPNEFIRSIETQRVLQIMEAWDSADAPYFFGADMNDDISDPPDQPIYFYEIPGDMPLRFNLGNDIEFPVWNSVFGPLLDAVGGDHVNVVEARQLDGWDGTHFGRARLDYLWHSDAVETIGSEVYNSQHEDLGGGLPKFGDPLPPETSRTASDHLLVFADVLVTNAMSLAPPVPGVAGQINRFETSLAEPGSRVYLVAGLQSGSTPVPGCPGLDVAIRTPKVAGAVVADESGLATLDLFVPRALQGRAVHLQSVDPAWCSVSPPLVFTFQ